jgi:hypothetical protein
MVRKLVLEVGHHWNTRVADLICTHVLRIYLDLPKVPRLSFMVRHINRQFAALDLLQRLSKPYGTVTEFGNLDSLPVDI